MPIKVGEVEALFRYPVKSMSGELLEVADLGWHGLEGDRRLAFRRTDDRGGFPWLATVGEIGRLAEQRPDVRRFRPNILVASHRSVPFEEEPSIGSNRESIVRRRS